MIKEDLLDLAEKVRSGVLSRRAACDELNRLMRVENPLEADLIHFLCHYIADADIRERDMAYRMQQESYLEQLVEKVKQL